MSQLFHRAGIALGLMLAAMVVSPVQAGGEIVGAVYTMSNDASGNSVLVFERQEDGRLQPAGAYLTGGLGSGAGLGNQGAVIIDPANRWLFVVNAATDDVSVFAIEAHGLTWVDRVTTPLLILHGGSDERVPIGQPMEFYRALEDRGKTVELVFYPREGHGIGETPHQRDLYGRVLEWFRKYL